MCPYYSSRKYSILQDVPILFSKEIFPITRCSHTFLQSIIHLEKLTCTWDGAPILENPAPKTQASFVLFFSRERCGNVAGIPRKQKKLLGFWGLYKVSMCPSNPLSPPPSSCLIFPYKAKIGRLCGV